MIDHNDKEYTLEEALELFLSEPRKAEHSSWAKPTTDDMKLMDAIIYEMIERKFERDCDGGLPINYHVCDRTRFEPLTYVNIPYTHTDPTREDRIRAMELFSMLVSIYTGRLDASIRSLRYDEERHK